MSVTTQEDGLDFGGLIPAGAGGRNGSDTSKPASGGHIETLVETFGPLRSRIPEVGLEVPPTGKGQGISQVPVAPGSVEGAIGRFQTRKSVPLDQEVNRLSVERMLRQDQRGGAVSWHGFGFW